MKKIIVLLTALFIFCCLLTGCGSQTADKPSTEKKLRVVTTSFAAYDWTREIAGSNLAAIDLTLLNSKGMDMHSYQPSIEDIAKISDCDLFIYVGGESEAWAKAAIEASKGKKLQTISLLEVLGKNAKEEQSVEGMQEHKHEHNAEEKHHEHEHSHHEAIEYDEHVWLSLRNATLYVKAIANSLSALDAAHHESYVQNAAAYISKLESLDHQFSDTVAKAKNKTILLGDRFPFRYLTDDYGIKYYAAFTGCSAETEASFETISFLAQKLDELGIKTIFKLEGSTDKIANTIKENSRQQNQQVVELNSMQSINLSSVNKATTYFTLMENNLKSIAAALQ